MCYGNRRNSLFLSTQADTCIPKLNEGDQIVLINGRDISEHTHDQVVMFIKASRESHTRELALVIRRKGNRHRRGGATGPWRGGALSGPFRGFENVELVANIGKSRTFASQPGCGTPHLKNVKICPCGAQPLVASPLEVGSTHPPPLCGTRALIPARPAPRHHVPLSAARPCRLWRFQPLHKGSGSAEVSRAE